MSESRLSAEDGDGEVGIDADKAVEEFPMTQTSTSCADEMSMKRWSQRVKESIHLWEMEMKILLSDTRFDADDVRFVLVLEGQFTCKPESRSQKVELCVVKVNSQSVVLRTLQTRTTIVRVSES